MTTPTAHHLPTAPSPLMQRHVLARVEQKLTQRFAGAVPAETVQRTVQQVAAELKQGARLTTFLPALTEHEALNRLAAAAHAPVQSEARQDASPRAHARHAVAA